MNTDESEREHLPHDRQVIKADDIDTIVKVLDHLVKNC